MIGPQLRVIQGDLVDPEIPITKPAGSPPGEDWLRKLPAETRFLCQHKTNKGSRLDNYGIAAILPKSVMLYDFQVAMGSPFVFVISETFSRDNRLVEILPETPQQEGEQNGIQRHSPASKPRPVDDRHEGDEAGLPDQ